ncbi:MAG: acyl-CoA thioesterase [Alistipes sp.]|nr:acyl-CoA thioesterase [Alistipes sp.]
MARTIVTPIQMRFSDLDPFHHVNNVAQQMYFDVGKTDYYERVAGEELLADRLRIVTVSTQTSYLGQVRSGDRLTVTTVCERIGTKSLTLFQQLLADGEVRSESRSVLVAFDFAAQQSVAVPDRWRRRMTEE